MFLRLIVSYMVVKRVCLLRWIKPFKIPLLTFESIGTLWRSSDASAPRRLRYGDALKVLVRVCLFLLMNPWYNVLNHSKYRFLFHAVYIGIMNGIRKPTFHAARYNRLKYLGSDVRSRPLQSAPMAFFCARTVVILHREPTRPRKP